MYNNISDIILNSNVENLKIGIWPIIDNLIKDPYNFKTNGYKIMYPISQLISPLGDNNIFSFIVKRRYYCYDCL